MTLRRGVGGCGRTWHPTLPTCLPAPSPPQVKEDDGLDAKPKRRGKVMSDYEKWEIAQLIKSGGWEGSGMWGQGKGVGTLVLPEQPLMRSGCGRQPSGRLVRGPGLALRLHPAALHPAPGVLDPSEYPGWDEDEGGALANVDAEVEEEFEIDLNDNEPDFLRGQTQRTGVEMSPIKIVKNPDGSMQRAAMTQVLREAVGWPAWAARHVSPHALAERISPVPLALSTPGPPRPPPPPKPCRLMTPRPRSRRWPRSGGSCGSSRTGWCWRPSPRTCPSPGRTRWRVGGGEGGLSSGATALRRRAKPASAGDAW